MGANEAAGFPKDLSALSINELTALQASTLSSFNDLAGIDDIDDAGVAQLETYANQLEALEAAIAVAEKLAKSPANRAAQIKNRVAFAAKTNTAPEETEDDSETDETDEGEGGDDAPTTPPATTVEAASNVTQKKTPSLAAAQARAPHIPDTNSAGSGLVITAAAPRYGLPTGSRFGSLDDLVSATQNHAKAQVVTAGSPQFLTVATINNDFEHVVDGQGTSVRDMEYMLQQLRSPEKQDALIAAGGWCAPSEIKYDFFNVTCEDGMIDLPTFGVQRGGIQFPVSPSLADVFTGSFTNATNPWLWQEIDDIAAATGTGGNPSKPCVRVTCPTFDEVRLECYGICLTAGNLTDAAYPEATRNHLSLLMSAHFHAMNQRYIQRMVALSSAAVTGAVGSGTAILADAPAAVALAAQDYRTRYGMCDDDVLEVVFPRWVKDAMRVDHLRRTGFWEGELTDAQINALFAAFRVRVQWVADWQVRTNGLFGASSAVSDWPANVTFMIYAAGTFVRGNGLTLDLGVVRDSVLNATNDHTAAWTEECHLIARYGHESRQYTIPVCVAGRTGANDIVCANV